MSTLAQAPHWHEGAARDTETTMTAKLRTFALELGAPDELAAHLVVRWDRTSDGFHASVDDERYLAALEEAEYGSLDKAPLAVIRRFETRHARTATAVYEAALSARAATL